MIRLFRHVGSYIHRFYSSDCTSAEVTAGILIIGDEILKGITDVNTPFLIKQLNEINVKICKVAIVPDSVDAIAEEVAALSSRYTYVFTSGGIGPTHDDVTYEAVAKAFKDELLLNENLFNFLVKYFGPESKNNPGIIKYSHVPKSSFVNYIDLNYANRAIKYPIVSIRNIFILPGVPSLLQKSFDVLKTRFIQAQKMFTKDIYIDLDEFTVTSVLNKAVGKFSAVNFGSYPTFTDNYYKVRLLLESMSCDEIEAAYSFLYQQLPNCSIVNIKKDILLTAKDDVFSLSLNCQTVFDSISVIEKAMKTYSLSELCVCFNGGKDCTALIHLLYSCVKKLLPDEFNKVHFLYIKNGEFFEEIDNFIDNTVEMYNLSLTVLEGDLKQSVSHFLKNNANVKAVLMGTRKDDPGASRLSNFSLTDSDWPQVFRILPILSWTYSDVWYFIRTLQLPYCILYDLGFTSLGVKSQTVQNPSLLLHDRNGFRSYKPAYMLQNVESERGSRL